MSGVARRPTSLRKRSPRGAARGPAAEADSPEAPAPRKGPRLVAHIDGGARGNPGPAGYGVHLEAEDGGGVTEIYGYLGVATNNIAEYAALLALLEYAVQARPASLRVFSDSELLIRQMLGEYRVKDPKLKVLHAAARRLLAAVPGVSFEHVPRERNREADALANRAMDQKAGSGPLPGALRFLPAAPTQNRLL